jgi:Rit1 N-terminal domain
MPNSGSSEASARAYIRHESLDIYNRLHSIEADIAFVNQVSAAYPTFPVIRTALSLLFRLLSPLTHFTHSKSPLRSLVH